jgi:hypothetical protein
MNRVPWEYKKFVRDVAHAIKSFYVVYFACYLFAEGNDGNND